MRTTWVAALAVVAAACGQGRTDPVTNQQVPPAQDGTDPASAPPCGVVTVHLDAVNPGLVTALQLALTGISFSVDGAPLAPERAASGTLDLWVANEELAVLKLPRGGTVQGTMSVGATHACIAGSCFEPDACVAPIQFRFDPANVDPERCDVVVQLDLARSVYAAADAAAFLPQFSVNY